MAYELTIMNIPGLICGSSSLATKQYLGVKLASDGSVVIAASQGEPVVGVLQNKPTVGTAAQVLAYGVTKAIAGSAGVTANDQVTVDATGAFITAGKGTVSGSNVVGDNVVGTALATATSAQVFALLLLPRGAVPTTLA